MLINCRTVEVDLTPLKPTTFRLETEIMEALNDIREREGIAVSEQVRRALKQWIEAKGGRVKSPNRRTQTRPKG